MTSHRKPIDQGRSIRDRFLSGQSMRTIARRLGIYVSQVEHLLRPSVRPGGRR